MIFECLKELTWFTFWVGSCAGFLMGFLLKGLFK